MNNQRLQHLLDLYLSQQLSISEEQELFQLIDKSVYDEEIKEYLGSKWNELSRSASMNNEQSDRILNSILSHQQSETIPIRSSSFTIRRLAVAAAVVSLIFLSVFYIGRKTSVSNPVQSNEKTVAALKDLPPGQNGAILKLADGSALVLDSMQDGVIAANGNTLALKQGAQLNYADRKNNHAGELNTVETPRGRQFKLTLEDGTQVWLNASSSIRFPVAFTGTERKVEITGEVYFEVAKNKAKPFIVQTGSTKIEVLGTHFNINAYDDEVAVKTTLVEGSVRISKGNNNGILKPGQQAQASGTNTLQIRNNADIDEVLSWKNGRFVFTDADLETIMRQVSKWYDVEVQYSGNIPQRTFTADISRNTNLSEFLKVLELNKIHFLLQGRKLIVSP